MEALLGSLGALAQLGAEYSRAAEERRQQILLDADEAYRAYKAAMAGLPAALAASDSAADAAALALGGVA